jgi:uncharacterized membrane protein YgdD (TMEM256/DUF423 family)
MERLTFIAGSLLAALGVGLGAFGAHGLKAAVSAERLAVFETGVRYQMYGALGLLALAWAIDRWPERRLATAVWLLVVGTVIFSGSLYLLVLTDTPRLGAVTPFGGVAMIGGWALAAWRMIGDRSP